MRLYSLGCLGSAVVDDEITNVVFDQVIKAEDGGGVLRCRRVDQGLANIAENKGYLWNRVEVRKDDGSTVLWEGFITDYEIGYNYVLFEGIEGLRALDQIDCDYSALWGEGRISTVNDGGGNGYIEDENAAFTDAVLTKITVISDISQPSEESAYPNSNTTWYDPSAHADIKTGAYTDLDDGGTSCMKIWDGDKSAQDSVGIVVAFTAPNAATSTKVIIELSIHVQPRYRYTSSQEPLVEIWDQNASQYQSGASGDYSGVGRLTWNPTRGTRINHVVAVTGNISKYFNGTEIKVRVRCGTNSSSHGVTISYGKITNTYSTLFDGTVNFVNDVRTGTRLTFNGQTPVATAGVAVNDLYRIGDYLHNIVTEVWKSAKINYLDLDFDSSTSVEAKDLTHESVGNMLRDFAERDNRRLFQKIGWDISCKSSLTDTGIDITDADLIPDIYQNGWKIKGSSQNIINVVRLQGAAITAKQLALGLSNWFSPLSQLPYQIGYRGGTVSYMSQAIAQQKAVNIEIKQGVPDESLLCTVDLESTPAGAGSWANLDICKTIDVNLYSGTYQISAGEIKLISYFQNHGQNLKAHLTIEETSPS